MKKALLAAGLVLSFLLSGCSSEQKAGNPVSSEETTTIAATEDTTATTVKRHVDTTPVKGSEEYADVTFTDASMEKMNAFASDFGFGDASLIKDSNGVFRYPNYPAGKEITVTFKCDRELTDADISMAPYPGGRSATLSEIINTASFDSEEEHKKKTETFKKILTVQDGFYILTIPAGYAEQDNYFLINLYTKEREAAIRFRVSCIKEELLTTAPVFPIEDHAVMDLPGIKAVDFNFVNAKLPVSHTEHYYYAESPQFPAGQDIVITFKCSQDLSLSSVLSVDMNNKDEYGNPVSEDITVTRRMLAFSNGTYTLTIPAEYAVDGRSFFAQILDEEDSLRTSYMKFSFEIKG